MNALYRHDGHAPPSRTSIDHPDHLVTILAILFAERRDQKVIGVLEDARAKGE
jgi:hypothetical protein